MLYRYAAVALALILAPIVSAQGLVEQTAVRYLQNNWNRHNLEQADVANLVVTDEVPGPNESRIVYLRQSIGGVEVASGPMTVAIDRNGRVVHAAGRLTQGLSRYAPSASASVSAEAALTALARDASIPLASPFRTVSQKAGADRETVLSDAGVARATPTARLVYVMDGGSLRLAWETLLDVGNAAWFGWIDAATGRVITRDDMIVHDDFGPAHAPPAPRAQHAEAAPLAPFAARVAQHFLNPTVGGASYRVYAMPVESPLHAATPTPGDGRTVEADPHDVTASPFGWHDTDGAAGAEYTTTRGNNTHSYLDRNDDDNPDVGGEPDGGADLVFDFAIDFTQAPLANKDASVANLFYWNNIIHDVMYHYGFDEASGNFQENNYGNGGAGGDAVDAESQDGSGTNNANFFTPADGSEPRMQMYIGTNASPNVDGSFDNMVIVHEYGHGISIRLTGGPSNVGCLQTSFYPEQMGEGWSDYFGAVMTMEPGDARGDARPVGNYLFGQAATGPGIRAAPYSTDFGVNDYTYGDTNSSALSAPHGVGFVWATVLWEATWDMIDAHGWDPDIYNASGTAGNQMMLNLVVNALKLQPCGPGFVDGRDAILAADQLLYGGANQDILWGAFARRGLGFGASQGSNTSRSDQTESFIIPEADPPAAITDLSATPNGDFVTLDFTATGDDGTVGSASEYLVRYSASPILTETDWDNATPAATNATPQPSGTSESIVATGFDFSTAYHVAIKAVDDAFNVSDVSNSVAVTTLGPPAIDVATDPVVFRAEVGETDSQTLSIGNTGEGDLRYSVSLADAPATAALRAERYAAGAAARLAAAPEATRAVDVKEAPEARGERQLKDAGGPDGFGYRWIDSDEPGGPAYNWVDISGTGTTVSLSDDDSEQVSLPWDFPFYGNDRTSVYIGSNGILSFNSSGAGDYTNDPIPDADTPNSLIAVFWDDLNPATGGQVYYQDMGDGRFIVQWDGVPHYNTASETMTFQVIMYRSGALVYQYEEFNDDSSDPNGATIGIENADGTDGLQIVNNAAYVHEGLAIRISAFWGDVTAAGSGRVASGSSETVEITADATGLLPGTYNGVMTISSNDPATGDVEIPLQLVVTDATSPAASLSASSVSMDVRRGESETQMVTLSNTGASDLTWSMEDATGTMPDWLSMDVTSGTLAPGATEDIVFTLDPGVSYPPASTQQTTIHVVSNDPTSPLSLPVTMNVLAGTANEDDLDFDGPYVFRALSPNPVSGQATATFAVREPQTVTVAVYDALGRRVALVHEGAAPAMTRQTVTLDAADLASGAYVLVLRGETFTASQRITIAR